MFTKILLLGALAAFWWLIKRDNRLRDGVSSAVWIPTLWVGILASRPLSTWLGFGGGTDTTEGSPMDRMFYMLMIFAALAVLSRRRVVWPRLISENWGIFLFYGFLLVSVLWANSPLTSFKRWFKELGNIFVLLIILTEANPQQALRAVFYRCGCVLISLSVIFVRWFPDLGRTYNIHSGEMQVTGVTFQKNSLGSMILVCGIIILWDWLELKQLQKENPREKLKLDLNLRIILLLMGAYLLHLCDSKTSMGCLALGGGVVLATRLRFLRDRLRMLGAVTLAIFIGYMALDQLFGVKDAILQGMGRNATLTGRTDVWKALMNAGTDPLLGTGYMDFWDDPRYLSKQPDGDTVSAHNGYLEIYLCGGAAGVTLLAVMILASGRRINQALIVDGDYGVVRFAVLLVALIANYTETNFAWMTPIGFLFLTAAIGHAESAATYQPAVESGRSDPEIIDTGAPFSSGKPAEPAHD